MVSKDFNPAVCVCVHECVRQILTSVNGILPCVAEAPVRTQKVVTSVCVHLGISYLRMGRLVKVRTQHARTLQKLSKPVICLIRNARFRP